MRKPDYVRLLLDWIIVIACASTLFIVVIALSEMAATL